MTEERMLRTEMLLGREALQQLGRSRVTLCGLGAVGTFALEALARAGVGHLVLVDFDRIHSSNINRQLLALTSTVGQKKYELARQRVLDINPACDVDARELFLGDETLPQALDPRPDVLIDAIDSLNPKVRLLYTAHGQGLRVVSAMGAATRLDPHGIRVGPLMRSEGCPLARFVRKRLRHLGVKHCDIRAVYSTESVDRSYAMGEQEAPEPNAPGRGRRPLGSCVTMTGLFGLHVAHETLRLLLGVERWDQYSVPLTEDRA